MCKSLETFVDVQCAIGCLKTCSDDGQQKSQFSCHQNFTADPPTPPNFIFFYAVIPRNSRVTIINTASMLLIFFFGKNTLMH